MDELRKNVTNSTVPSKVQLWEITSRAFPRPRNRSSHVYFVQPHPDRSKNNVVDDSCTAAEGSARAVTLQVPT
jgi:hypothetical protein